MMTLGDTEFRDRRGIRFEDHRLWLPEDISCWRAGPRIAKDSEHLQNRFHYENRGKPCWRCRRAPKRDGSHQLHHLFAGSKGRSHERELFMYLCQDCHANHVGREDLGALLYLKWKHDPLHTDWVWLALRYGSFLPDLEVYCA